MKFYFIPLLLVTSCYGAEGGAESALSRAEKFSQLSALLAKHINSDYNLYRKMRGIEDAWFKHFEEEHVGLEGCARLSILTSKEEKFSKKGIQLFMKYCDPAHFELSFITPWGVWKWAKTSALFFTSHGDMFCKTSEFVGIGVVDFGELPDYLEGVQKQDSKERNKKWWAMMERYETERVEQFGLPRRIQFSEI